MKMNQLSDDKGQVEMSSIRKTSDSLSSQASSPPQPPDAPRPSTCRGNLSYPVSSPWRRNYLAARFLGIIFAIVLVILAIVTLTAVPRGKWSAAVLSPAISTLFASGIEVWRILGQNRRAHYWHRTLYDGALGIGYAISFGFLVSFTSSDISRSNPKSTQASAGIGMSMLLLEITEVFLQFAYMASGIKEWRRSRRSHDAAV